MSPTISRANHEEVAQFAGISKRLARNFFRMVECALRAEASGSSLEDDDEWNGSFPNQSYYTIIRRGEELSLVIGVELDSDMPEDERDEDEKELACMLDVLDPDDSFIFKDTFVADAAIKGCDLFDRMDGQYKKGHMNGRHFLFIPISGDEIPDGLDIEKFDRNNSKK